MGEVYRARDNRLNREVALRILSAEFAADPERLQRLARKAQTLAALNHPHIAQIYGLEDTGDGHALVMELVDGEDLRAQGLDNSVAGGSFTDIANESDSELEEFREPARC